MNPQEPPSMPDPCYPSLQQEHTTLLRDLCAGLARMETKMDAIYQESRRTNGRTTLNEERISEILEDRLPAVEAKVAGEQSIVTGWSRDREILHARITKISDGVDTLLLWRASTEGQVSGGWRVVSIIGAIMLAVGGAVGAVLEWVVVK